MKTAFDINQEVFFESNGVVSGIVKEIRIDENGKETYSVRQKSGVSHIIADCKLSTLDDIDLKDKAIAFAAYNTDYYMVKSLNNASISIARTFGVCCVDFAGKGFALIKKTDVSKIMGEAFDEKSLNDLVYFNKNFLTDPIFISSLKPIDSAYSYAPDTIRFAYTSVAKNFVLSLNPKIASSWLNNIEDDDLTTKPKAYIWQIFGEHSKYRFDHSGEYLIVNSNPIDFKTINVLGTEWEFELDMSSEKILVLRQMGDISPIYYCYKIKSLTLTGNIVQRLSRVELAVISKLKIKDEDKEQLLSKFVESDYGIDQDRYREED